MPRALCADGLNDSHEEGGFDMRLASALTIVLLALGGIAHAGQVTQGPSVGPPPGPPREYVPYDPSKEPAFRGEGELRKGADSVRSGESPFPQIVKKVGPDLYELGTITLDTKARKATIPGRINMTQGIIEYLAVMDKRGKLHESVLALDVQPSLFQLALILLGFEPGEVSLPSSGSQKSPTLSKWGDPVTLWVEWDRTGTTERISADALIFNRETQRTIDGNRWHFTGSAFYQNTFAADLTGSLIATWMDWQAIINASAQIGNPYRGANLGYEVNSKIVPPLDTPIRLVIEPAEREPTKAQ